MEVVPRIPAHLWRPSLPVVQSQWALYNKRHYEHNRGASKSHDSRQIVKETLKRANTIFLWKAIDRKSFCFCSQGRIVQCKKVHCCSKIFWHWRNHVTVIRLFDLTPGDRLTSPASNRASANDVLRLDCHFWLSRKLKAKFSLHIPRRVDLPSKAMSMFVCFFIQYLKDYQTGHEVLIEGLSKTEQVTRKKEKIEV